MVISAGIHLSPLVLPLAALIGGIAWFLPVLASLAAGLIGSKTQPKGPKMPPVGSPMYDYLTTGMIPGSEQGGGGGSSSESTTNFGQTQTTDMSTFPFITDQYKGIEGLLRARVMDRLLQGSSLPVGYEEQGIADINKTYDATNRGVSNQLLNMGLMDSKGPTATALSTVGAARAGDIGRFRTQLPLQERQMANEDMNLSAQIMDLFGKGQRTKGTVKTSGSSTTSAHSSSSGGGHGPVFDPSAWDKLQQYQPKSKLPSFFNNMLGTLGLFAGSGAFGGKGGGGAAKLPSGPDYGWLSNFVPGR